MNDRDPWQALQTEWPWIRVFIRHLPDLWGQTVWSGGKPRIELAHDLGPVQQRCTLAHELHHLIAGKPCRSLCDDNEKQVIEATARWLLPDVDEIGTQLRVHDISRAAERLGVTLEVLNDRLVSLHPAEEAQLQQYLAAGAGGGTHTRAHYQPRRSAREQPRPCRAKRHGRDTTPHAGPDTPF